MMHTGVQLRILSMLYTIPNSNFHHVNSPKLIPRGRESKMLCSGHVSDLRTNPLLTVNNQAARVVRGVGVGPKPCRLS
jgi:hypothetical protein